MPTNTQLPEGTDSIITGASASGTEMEDDFAAETDAGLTPELDDVDAQYNAIGANADAGLDDAVVDSSGSATGRLGEEAGERTAGLREQAGDKARDYATQGKERATAALDNVSRMIGDAAAQVDEKVGAEYGDYARRAQGAVDDFAGALRNKDVDELFADARDFVRRSPGIAIGAAAAIGFALVRVVKAGLPQPVEEAAPEPRSEDKRRAKGKSAA